MLQTFEATHRGGPDSYRERAISCQPEKLHERKDAHRKPPRVLGAGRVADVVRSFS